MIALPYKWYPRPQIVSGALAWRLVDITEANGQPMDLAICTKWPSYVVQHPCKVTWLVHQFRQIYDWFGTPLSRLHRHARGRAHPPHRCSEMDRTALLESREIFTISRNVADRLRALQRPGGHAPLPAFAPGLRLEPGPYGDYILSLNRLDAAKRVDLLLEALALAPGVRAVIAGTGPDADALKRKAARPGHCQTGSVRRLRLGRRKCRGFTPTPAPSTMRPWTRTTATARWKPFGGPPRYHHDRLRRGSGVYRGW